MDKASVKVTAPLTRMRRVSVTAPVTGKKSSLPWKNTYGCLEEKFQILKSLHAVLVKQFTQKRSVQDDSLEQVSDENFGLKIELGPVFDLIESRVREIGVELERLMREKSDGESEIRVLRGERNELMGKVEMETEEVRKVCDERDLIKNRFDLQSEEANRLKECVVRLEEKESDLETVIGKLKSENDKLVKEREMREVLIEVVNKDKIGREAKLFELNQKADELAHTVAVLQKDCDSQTKINEKLSCKVGQLSNSLAQVELKREEADKALVEEKRHVEDLQAMVLKSKKTAETTATEEIEGESLLTAQNILESQCESLKIVKAIFEEDRVRLEEAMGALKTKVEVAGMEQSATWRC